MKKNIIAFALTVGLIVLAACQSLTAPSMAATTQSTTCRVYSMKSWFELAWKLDGSFSQNPDSDGGINSQILLSKAEIDFLKSLNGPGTGSWTWQWAADAEQGKYYQSIAGISINQQVYWNWVAAPSPDQRIPQYAGKRNVMCVSKIVRMYGEDYAFIVAAPRGLDYAKYQLDWLVQPVYGNWEWQKNDGTWAGMPHIWNAYMFDPSTFPNRAKSDQTSRFPAAWLDKYIRTDTIPWRATATSTSTPIIDITTTQTPITPTGITLVDGVVYPRPKTCKLVTLKTRDETGDAPDGSFGQWPNYTSPSKFDSPDVNNKTTLGKAEIDVLIAKNQNLDGTWIYKNWLWAADGPRGLYYQSIVGYSIYNKINWNWVIPSSARPFDRNTVCVDADVNGFYEIVTAPKMTNYDSVKNIPWLNYRVAANYRVGVAANNWNSGEYLWNGFLFDPSTFPTTKGNDGYWMPKNYIYQDTGVWVEIPWRITQTPVTPTPTVTITPTPTSTATIAPPSITPTPSPTPVSLPVPALICFRSIWPAALHERPSPSMHNVYLGVSVEYSGIVPAESVINNSEGSFAQVNSGTFFALELKSNGRTYAVKSGCP